MILAILDDLLFMSKIRSTAQHVDVAVVFAKSSQQALEQARRQPPALVVVDLNNPRTSPIETIVAMKADSQLRGAPIVGYASHVDGATIAAARAAGADEVLARSAFTTQLADILGRARHQP